MFLWFFYCQIIKIYLELYWAVGTMYTFSRVAEGETDDFIYDFFVLIFCISNLIAENVFKVCSINVRNLRFDTKGSCLVSRC